MRRVLAFVHKPKGISPGQRFRLEQWEPHLRGRHGIELDFEPFESAELTELLYQPGRVREKASLMVADFWRRRLAVLRAERYDAAVLYREVASLGPAIYERVLAHRRVPVVLDFDDAIWLPTPSGPRSVNGRFSRLRFAGKTRTIARLASAVTVGNTYLAEWSRRFCRDVTVVPTTIDLARYSVQPSLRNRDRFVIVWMGSFSTLKYLELVRRPIERLAAERRVEVRVVCDRPFEPGFAGATNTFVRWTADGEARDIGQAHVGIMPLDDTEYSRGKCACKALQYMAAGRACVVAPVGVNADIVKHGVNGLLAADDAEWYEALRALAEDEALRDRLALRGRATVEDGFSSEVGAAAFAEVIERVARAAPGYRSARS